MRIGYWLALAACSGRVPAGADASGDAAGLTIDSPRAIDADLGAPTDVPAVPCTAAPADVYAVAPATGAARGAILACAPDGTMTVADAGSAIGSGMTATSAVAMFRIAYATRDRNGGPAVSTARVYLPVTPRARPVPIVVAAHGSVGLADSCVPSTSIDSSLPLPYAARGFAAIAPDLAGLGNAGTQDYLNNRVQGWQLLDGARALRAVMAPGITAESVILTGYSQGGGAALSAHSLAELDGPGVGTLVATVVYAPEWPIRLASFDYINILRNPTELTIQEGLSNSSVAVLRQYAFFENALGAGHGVDAFPAAARAGLPSQVDSQCLVPFGGYVQTTMLHAGDLIDDTLRTDLVTCVDAGACSGNAALYYNFLIDNVLAPDPHAGPVLIAQGLLDQIMPPAHEAACVYDKLAGAGVDVDTCVFGSSDHSNIMDQHASGEAWAESVLAGGTRAECDPSTTLPSCQ